MEFKYIFAISCGGLFVLLFLIYLIVYFHTRKKRKLQAQRFEKMYADENLVRMDYDFAVYDEETSKIIAEKFKQGGQLTIDDVMSQDGAIEEHKEDIEELTGNYKPQ